MSVDLGYFVYEDAGTGCLFSKYCNADLQGPLTESASRIKIDSNFPNDPFCGEFLATWVENLQNSVSQSAKLIITRKLVNNTPLSDIYTVVWQDLTGTIPPLFTGEAMLYKNLLIGAYK